MNPAHGSFPPASSWTRCKHGAQSFTRGSASTAQVSPERLVERYKQGELHAVSLLHNLASIFQFRLELKETVTPDYVQGLYFAFCVVINDVMYKTGIGNTKKDARRQAAQLALQELLPRLESLKEGASPASGVASHLPVQELPSESRPPEAQTFRACHERKLLVNLQIPHAVRDQLTTLMNIHPEFSDCAGSTAAFIMETAGRCEVIAIGSGNINARENRSTDGRLLHDSHAVVTARRSLMRFLYRHLLMFFSKEAILSEKSVLEQNSSSSLLSLKRDITLHLYINQLPKGAAHSLLHLKPLSICAWEAMQDMGLHLAVEGKVFPVSSIAVDHSNSNLVSMSAADKLAQWQVLGYQGALLSHFIEPVYVHNIFSGDPNCSDARSLEFSVSQRVEGITSKLPMYYCMIRPRIILVPNVPASAPPGGRHPTYSINWIQGDVSLEVVDGLEGRTIEESPFRSSSALASRLCKAAMLHRFKLVAKDSEREDLLAAGSYRKLKKMATPYQEAKSILRAHLMSQGFGSWLAKVSVCENFCM